MKIYIIDSYIGDTPITAVARGAVIGDLIIDKGFESYKEAITAWLEGRLLSRDMPENPVSPISHFLILSYKINKDEFAEVMCLSDKKILEFMFRLSDLSQLAQSLENGHRTSFSLRTLDSSMKEC